MSPPLRRVVSFLLALAIQSQLGAPPPDPATGKPHRFWLDSLLGRAAAAAPWPGGPLAQSLPALALPLLLARFIESSGRRLGPAGLLLEAALLALTFDLLGPARAAACTQAALERDDLDAAEVALGPYRPESPSADAPSDARQLAQSTVASLGDQPAESFLTPWLCYALFGTGATVTYRAAEALRVSQRPTWLKLAAGWTARRGRIVRAESAHLAAPLIGLAVFLVRPGGAEPQRVWGALAAHNRGAFARGPLHGLRSLPGGRAAMAAALHRQLPNPDGDPYAPDAPPVAPSDIARARSIYLTAAALAAALVAAALLLNDTFRAPDN